MSLIRKHDTEVERVEPSGVRSLFDWPLTWTGLFEEALPRLEEFTDGDTLVVRAEMPGIDPEHDVDITVANGTLRIQAERKEESTSEEKTSYRSEFRYGSFTRTLPLPAGATEDDVKATYRDGILEVRIPVNTTQAEARKVPVGRT
jgi:HSP20 family protein